MRQAGFIGQGETAMFKGCISVGFMLIFVFAVEPTSLAQNSPPEVTNVTASQRKDASKMVDITYDLSDADGDACTVWVLASDDNGSTWTVPITALDGAVGSGITPGTGKKIEWNPSVDIPGVTGTNFKVRVCADDGNTSGGMANIPGGEFEMGDHHDNMSWCLPVHTVYISSFHMDIYEVTNAQYCCYLNSAYSQGLIEVNSGVVYKKNNSEPYCNTTTSSSYSRIHWDGGTETFSVTPTKEDHPMVEVSWYGAVAYANWRSAQQGLPSCYDLQTWECSFGAGGYRLPTEAEWEYAARGGEYYYRYPWGNNIDGSKANYAGSGDPYETGPDPLTTPVGYYNGNQTPSGVDMANGYGLYDMAGNVWEWCNDWYDSSYYSSSPPYNNPKGPSSSYYRVLRGGAWDGSGSLTCAYRGHDYPGDRYYSLGFRLALD